MMIKLDCGLHYGIRENDEPKTCKKCQYLNSEKYRKLIRNGTQYDGTPWTAMLGEKIK